VRLSTRGAAHHCPADAEAWSNPRRPTGRGVERFVELQLSPRARRHCAPAAPVQPPRERPMTLVRPESGLRHHAAPQLHR
jgi:hypothetical protein